MNSSTRVLIGSLSAVVLVGFSSLASQAHVVESHTFTADQVRAEFVRAGYVAGVLTVGEDGATVFAVDDAATGLTGWPRLRVYVFADDLAAAAAHRQAHGREEAYRNRTIRDSDDRGPQLLSGYGVSVWHRNVALIQASNPDDRGAFPVELDCAPELITTGSAAPELSSANYTLSLTGVNPVFVELLMAMYTREGRS